MFQAVILSIRVDDSELDVTGPLLQQYLNASRISTEIVERVPSEQSAIEDRLRHYVADPKISLIITNGGTGIDLQDVTPEATKAVCQRLLPGIPDAMRHASLKITGRALFCRSQAGICNQTLIINVPGSPKAAVENLNVVLDALPHALSIITGQPISKGQIRY